jgi:DNA-directed RNA polymerase subunit F
MNSKEMFEVLNRVRTWDPEMRIDLVRRILGTVVPEQILPPPQTMTLEEIQAIMKTDKRPPTDEECKQILEEECLKKYGTLSLE